LEAMNPHKGLRVGLRLRRLGRLIANWRTYRRMWAEATDATDRQDWAAIIHLMGQIGRLGLATNRSLHWLGSAYCMSSDWGNALAAYEQISGRLQEPEAESRRIVNHATALLYSSRPDEAEAILVAADTAGWATGTVGAREKLLIVARGFERPSPEPAPAGGSK